VSEYVFAVKMETLRELKDLHGFSREKLIEVITDTYVECLDEALNSIYPEDE